MIRGVAKDFPEVIARLLDSQEDGDMENPVTAGLVEALSKCDLIIGGVLRYITDENTIHDDAYWWGAYATVGDHPSEQTQIGEAQRMLAELFGGVHIEGLQERLNAALRVRQRSDENEMRALKEKHAVQSELLEAKNREGRLERALADIWTLARQEFDNSGSALASAILGRIGEHDGVSSAVTRSIQEREREEQERREWEGMIAGGK